MKAILLIDMPNNCYNCQYCRFDARKYNLRGCVLTDTDVQDGTIDIRKEVHSCCPLKPMPERKEVHYTDPLFGEVENLTNIGYNKCLDDLGETESDLSTDEGWWRDYELYEMQND